MTWYHGMPLRIDDGRSNQLPKTNREPSVVHCCGRSTPVQTQPLQDPYNLWPPPRIRRCETWRFDEAMEVPQWPFQGELVYWSTAAAWYMTWTQTWAEPSQQWLLSIPNPRSMTWTQSSKASLPTFSTSGALRCSRQLGVDVDADRGQGTTSLDQ